MRPGLDAIRALCAALGNPQDRIKAIHVAGTNGKGAVCALLSAALEGGRVVGRYTSPHLVRLNERFVIDGRPVSDEKLEEFAKVVNDALCSAQRGQSLWEVTFFEALTAMAFRVFADAGTDFAILECGLGGRLDATNVCLPELCVITRIGLDHCDWLGDTVEKVAAEKAGIIKPGVPVVLGENGESVRTVVSSCARAAGAPFFYAPDLASGGEMPADLPLGGAFNRENAVTALAALRVLASAGRIPVPNPADCFSGVVWPGRFQLVGGCIVDGAHNPPAAVALAASLESEFPGRRLPLVAGFCGDKDVDAVLRLLAPHVLRGFAVRTCNPRSLSAEETAALMRGAGIAARPCGSLAEALREAAAASTPVLVCGSLFLAGEALVELGAYPWGGAGRCDPAELLVRSAI